MRDSFPQFLTPLHKSFTLRWRETISDTWVNFVQLTREKKLLKTLLRHTLRLKRSPQKKWKQLTQLDLVWLWISQFFIMKSKTTQNKLVNWLRLHLMMLLLILRTFKTPTTKIRQPSCNWWKTIWLFGHQNLKKRMTMMIIDLNNLVLRIFCQSF